MKSLLFVLVLLLALSGSCRGLIERLYCGMDNCYDLLGVTREATSAEIRRAYRKLAILYHPDKNKEKGARKKFEKIATAYEVLKDEEERSNYDYMLDHPEEVYGHYYRYYRRRTPSIDVRLVVGVLVAVISLCQYSAWMHSYRMAIAYALGNPGYRARAREFAQSNDLLRELESKKVGRDITKAELRVEESNILSKVLEENLNITGGYGKPKITDVLFFQLILLPYTILKYLHWYGQWVWKFTIKKEPYGPEEKEYLTRKALKLTEHKWAAMGPEQREDVLERELWIKENFDVFHKEQHEAMKAATADSSKHKMYRRYMKSRGKRGTTTD